MVRLSPKEESALVKKLRKAKRTTDAIAKAAPGVDPYALLWDLLSRGAITLADIAKNDGLASGVREAAESAPAELAISALSRLEAATHPDLSIMLPGLSYFVWGLVSSSSRREPETWTQALPGLPRPLRDALLLTRPELLEEEDSQRLRNELAAAALDEQAENVCRRIALFIGDTPQTWGRRLLPHLATMAPKHDCAEEALELASWEQLASSLHRVSSSWTVYLLVKRVLPKRSDPAPALVSLASSLREQLTADDHGLRALLEILVIAKRREPEWVLEQNWDPVIETALEKSWFYTRESVVAVMNGVPQARALQIYQRLAAKLDRHIAAPLLRCAYDEELARALLEESLERAAAMTGSPDHEPVNLGLIGERLLPTLESEHQKLALVEDAARRARRRGALRKSIIVAIVSGERPGQPGQLEEYLSAGEDAALWRSQMLDAPQGWFARAIGMLPEPAARRVLGSWLDIDRAGTLGVRRALEYALSSDRARAFLEPEEPPADRIRRLVRETGEPADTRIYILVPAAPEAGSLCRTASRVRGLAGVPSYRGRPMEHVITFDLECMPELRQRADCADARALALFISSRGHNRAWFQSAKDTALVALSAEQAAQGHDDEGGGYSVHPVVLPHSVFDGNAKGALGLLRTALLQLHGRALGEPQWLQEESNPDGFLAQIDAELVPGLNLGGSGLLYVFPWGAFWQR